MTARTGSVLGERALNRALLARQGLLDRLPGTMPRVLERIGGIQAQYAPSMYVGLWSRMATLERDDVTAALESRRAVQATLMRSTIHLVSARDYWPFAAGLAEGRRAQPETVAKGVPPRAEQQAAAARLREALAHGPLTRTEVDRIAGRGMLQWAGLWVDLVRVPPSGTWERRRADLFGLGSTWVPPPADLDPTTGLQRLVQAYLTGFGPARPREIADWIGIPPRVVIDVVGDLALRRFAAEDGSELVDLPRMPLPAPDTPAPVRFLPHWDATLLVHCRRTQLLAERHRPRVFSIKTPQSVATFLVDGAVAGAWRYVDGRIELDPYEPIPAAARRELDAEGERLAVFMS